MVIELTPLDDIEAAVGGNSEHATLIQELNTLPTKAASFVAPFVDDELKKYKKALQTAANRFDLSVRFGVDKPGTDAGTTVIQAKLVPKQAAAGRPVVGPVVAGQTIEDLEDTATEQAEKTK